jgi:Icc-related predicted phosphoesterase
VYGSFGSFFDDFFELGVVADVLVAATAVGAVDVGAEEVPVDGGAGAGVDVVVVVVLWCLGWGGPASGSVYWLSPADGPFASAQAGPSRLSNASASAQTVVTRRDGTLRVLHPMRVLAFSDLHRDRKLARRLVAMSEEADVVIGVGDFASMHLGLGRTLDELAAIRKPTVLVPGNNERAAALWRAAASLEHAIVLHGEGRQIDGVDFFGLGAGVPPTPFPWSWDLTEDEAAGLLAGCPGGAVLAVHSPPHGYLDEAFGRHLGSRSILSAIESKRPALVVCGHIHQCWGQEARIGATPIANVGPHGKLFEV